MFELTNKVALVTGARRGMGRTHALMLAKQGAAVALTDIDAKQCMPVAEEITSSGGKAQCYQMDVSKQADVDRVFGEVVKEFGRLDILVNNAGIYTPQQALDMSEKEWDEVLNVNLKGQFLCAQRAAKEMKKHSWGRIINISSIASGGVGIGLAGTAHYAASKGGIIGMTETLAVEWAPLGILINAVAPGAIDTPMVRQPGEPLPKEIDALLNEHVPLRRLGKPEEVSAMVVFLASEESSYVTGATFYVDGGWLAA